jgi:uptake hydrogenase large subunit
MSRLVMGPFNRVEGDLEVSLDIADGKVAAAYVNSPLYRGFENLLLGRPAMDALVMVPRICGICSISQSAAAAAALGAIGRAEMPANGQLASNVILASEVLCDHLTHFYLFFMPDFARDAYAGEPWHADAAGRFKAMHGAAAKDFLPARARFLAVLGLLAGKWPHTLALRPGGTTRTLHGGEKVRLLSLLREFRGFLEQRFFADRLETVVGLETLPRFFAWTEASAARGGDWSNFLQIGRGLGMHESGRATDRYLSVGAYPQPENRLFLPAGVWDAGRATLAAFDPAQIGEDHASSWLDGPPEAVPPARGHTRPQIDKPGAYSWCKAPRYAGRVVETGALARQLVAGQPLLRELVAAHGGSVLARVAARGIEVAQLVLAMEAWIKAIDEPAPFHAEVDLPLDGTGVGLVEAARGALGHWVRLEAGKLASYQIISPTTWNFSPRDGNGSPGALEQALAGLPLPAHGQAPLAVQHIVRSFDPCMACTVH